MKSFDSRQVPEAKREALAWRIRNLSDVKMPNLESWNDKPCDLHAKGWTRTYLGEDGSPVTEEVTDEPKPGCRQCGASLRAHQRVGALWLYYKKKALLADTVGLGKTYVLAGLLSLMTETGELGKPSKGGKGGAIIVPRAPALHQWAGELKRVLPDMKIMVADVSAAKRKKIYMSDWDILLVGPETFRNDYKEIAKFPRSILVTDDVDPMRNAQTQTSRALDFVGERTDRYVITSGTPLQKKLPEMHQVTDAIGGKKIFGSLKDFTKMYVKMDKVPAINPKTGERFTRKKITGYHNLDDFKTKLAPLVLRRTAKDVKDVKLPVIQPNDIYLELYPRQRKKYQELQKGVVRLLKEEGELVKNVTALSRIHYGAAICAGLAALGEEDAPGTSVKIDYLMQMIGEDGDLGEEKVVVFANLKHDQPLDSGVLTPTGWTRMGDIREGDVVISADGTPTAVTGVMPKGVNPVYQVTFDDGTTAESSESHLWQFRSGRKRYVKGSGRAATKYALEDWRVGSLADMRATMEADAKTASAGPSKYRPHIPLLSEPVQYEESAALPLHPYLLGVILGDGWTGGKQSQPGFCTTDPEIAKRVRSVLPAGVGMTEHTRRGSLVSYRFGGTVEERDSLGRLARRNAIGAAIDSLGLTGTKSHTKFIPEAYKRASVEDRMELVRGLMDTDGNERGQFVVVSELLAADLAEVARSLGAWSSFRPSKSGDTLTWTTMIATDKFDIAHLERKKYRTTSRLVKRVVSIEYSRSTETQCLEVAHSSHLYVTDGMTLTHNTVRVIQQRMRDAGIGFVTIWGEETDKSKRMEAQNRFWDDPNCRVLIGTRAIEQSLNLQVSRHLVNVDMILNPARMEQLAGRVRRQGSEYSQVFVHNLLTTDTQEQRYMEMIETEAALSGHVWEEQSELFKAISSTDLLKLISGG